MTSSYANATTNWDRTAAEEPEEQAEAQEAPTDGWTELQTLAQSAMLAAEVEHMISDVFARRATLARRLSDASKRKDGVMAGEAARDWLRSEARLYKLFENYASYMQERDALLKSMPAEILQALG